MREKEISFDLLVDAIESGAAGRLPPHRGRRSPGAGRAGPHDRSRDRLGAETGRGGRGPRGVRRHPRRLRPDRGHRPPGRSSCSGCATPRTTSRFGEFSGREGDIVSGVVQQGPTRGTCSSTSARSRRVLPPQEQVPGEKYEHGDRLKCYVVPVREGPARPAGHAVAHPPQPGARSCSRSRCPRSPTAPWRSPRSPARPATAPRSPCARTVRRRQREGRLHRPDGPAGARRHGRAARREDRHRRLVGGPGRDGRPRAVPGPGAAGSRSSTRRRAPPG